MPTPITLIVDRLQLRGSLLDTPVARALAAILPVEVSLDCWGDEAYGSVGHDLGEHRLQPSIPAGGLAYTRQGEYLCLFYGQQPAWAVDHIGEIEGWEQLRGGSWRHLRVERGSPGR